MGMNGVTLTLACFLLLNECMSFHHFRFLSFSSWFNLRFATLIATATCYLLFDFYSRWFTLPILYVRSSDLRITDRVTS